MAEIGVVLLEEVTNGMEVAVGVEAAAAAGADPLEERVIVAVAAVPKVLAVLPVRVAGMINIRMIMVGKPFETLPVTLILEPEVVVDRRLLLCQEVVAK